MSLEKKKIVLGITGGIAAFKAASIASQLRKQGAEVKCIMTDHATKLITPLTMREISGNPVAVSMFDDVPEFNVEHIALARWADVFVIAPATADIIGKIANGIADDMLSTTVMATTAPVLIAPAMNTNMYLNPITQDNMAKLKKFGYHFIEPDSGHLACGIDGVGRLPEPDTIVDYIELLACRNDLLKGKKVLVTAGGTREPIDPVRFIGNHSSGRMGFAIAKAAVMAGAEVTLVAGTTDNLKTPVGLARRVDVGSTRDMKAAVDSPFDREKLIKGIFSAIKKRPVSIDRVSSIADHVENYFANELKSVAKSKEIGELVLEQLKDIDPISYIRFASVYEDFTDIESFISVISELDKNKDPSAP